MLSTVKNFDDRELKWKTSFVFVKIKDMCGLTKVQMLCSALYSKVQYSTVQYSTVQYSTVQYITCGLYLKLSLLMSNFNKTSIFSTQIFK